MDFIAYCVLLCVWLINPKTKSMKNWTCMTLFYGTKRLESTDLYDNVKFIKVKSIVYQTVKIIFLKYYR